MKLQSLLYKLSAIAVLSFLLSACGGSGGGDSSSVPTRDPGGPGSETISILYGSVGDGPIVGATVNVYDNNGNLLLTQSSDNTANYEMSVRTTGNVYPLTVEAVNGMDVVTGQKPDFVLKSVVLSPGKKKRININPFSTMIVETAMAMPGGLTAANVDSARQIVLSQFNFGLDTTRISDPISAAIDESNVATIIKSSETFGEMLRRSGEALGLTADQVVTTLAADLSDGVIDGVGAAGADPLVAAVATTASAQVLVEAMAGRLNVNNTDATAAMNNAISISSPGYAGDVNSLPVVAEMLSQSYIAVAAVQVSNPDPLLASTSDALNGIAAGSLPSDIALLLPLEVSTALTDSMTNVVQATDTELDQINLTVKNGGQLPATTVNTAPTIDGVPSQSVVEKTSYSFVPTATDVDGDSLTFSINNRPPWASFDTASGALSGIPQSSDVGTTSGIVISVTDGTDTVALPSFSITVTAIAATNSAPIISGTPAFAVDADASYAFVPTASDADGDPLSFSVSNLPGWASFNTTTGAITGVPSAADIGASSNISITVSDGVATASLPAFSITVNSAPVGTGTATLSWIPPTQNTDGSPLTDLAGYRIYYGTTSGAYSNVINVNSPGIASYVVEGLPAGYTYYFVITAIDGTGMESEYSTEGSKSIL